MIENFVWCHLFAAIFIVEAVSQEIPTPASFLEPRNFNYHPYELRQYLEESKPTKQGPVLFPNDDPPSQRRPLVVTARPLIEAIEYSNLNPSPLNNSITQNNPLNHVYPLSSPRDVTLSPDLLANISPISNYNLFGNSGAISVNNVPEATSYKHVPYADMLQKARLKGYARNNEFDDYEERTVLPPIYKALTNHARQIVLKPKPPKTYNDQIQNVDYGTNNNRESDENNNGDYDQDQNYAFSYRVNDQKTGDDYSHKQQSVSGGTNGEYRVRLPDGRVQIVSYTADENGYKADVRYDEGSNSVVSSHTNNDNNDQNNLKLYHKSNIESNNVKQNDNFIRQYDSNVFSNYNFNNVKQYENQNTAKNYYRPQENNINQYDDQILINNYVKYDNDDNNFKQYAIQNIENVYLKHKDGNVRQYDNVNLRNDYVNYKGETPIKEDPNQYNSREYYDYSAEYSQNYEPYNSKFAIFQPISTSPPIATTLRPNYKEFQPLFTVSPRKEGPIYDDGVLSANNPVARYESTTENVVLIGGKKFRANVNNIVPTEASSTVKPFAAVTPAAYLASTIASLRDRLTSKPVVFGNFINKLSKYLGVE